jgi:hypothetical protein
MEHTQQLIVEKNRKRAFWSLVIILFFVPISAWLILLGLQPGRPDVSWSLVLFGVLGLFAFGTSAILIIRTMRSAWRLALNPEQLTLYTPNYDLALPWDTVAGIAVDEVNHRPGCVMVFDDVAAVVEGASFHRGANSANAVTDAPTMVARMEENFRERGYHLGISGRILELGPEQLAQLLAEARTGELWEKLEAQPCG